MCLRVGGRCLSMFNFGLLLGFGVLFVCLCFCFVCFVLGLHLWGCAVIQFDGWWFVWFVVCTILFICLFIVCCAGFWFLLCCDWFGVSLLWHWLLVWVCCVIVCFSCCIIFLFCEWFVCFVLLFVFGLISFRLWLFSLLRYLLVAFGLGLFIGSLWCLLGLDLSLWVFVIGFCLMEFVC